MTPAQLSAASFAGYTPVARAFAVEHLSLLRRLPLAVCPSFLAQIQGLDTSFPAERANLAWQCDAFQGLSAEAFSSLAAPLEAISLSTTLQEANWLHAPAHFVTDLTAFLWSSGQLNAFRAGVGNLFAAVPPRPNEAHRLAIVLLGQDAEVTGTRVLARLRKHGVFLDALRQDTVQQETAEALAEHVRASPQPYAHWYVDGGAPVHGVAAPATGMQVVSYSGLSAIRERVVQRMQSTISSGSGGAEQMRTHLADTSAADVGAGQITEDPVLQRFYTELFTQSSGPQIFSTSFVQWTGRELARRAQPQTLLLRYAPRQRHHDLNELFAETHSAGTDPQGSFRDAEMGAYYNWIEMNRISAPGRLTFAAIVEGKPFAVVIGAGTQAGTRCPTPMTLATALKTFG